jgi:hypothetical protein
LTRERATTTLLLVGNSMHANRSPGAQTTDTETPLGTHPQHSFAHVPPSSVIARSRLAIALALLSLVGHVGRLHADPIPISARVVWVRGERVYVASPDSLAPGYGAQLTFLARGKPVASGEVVRVVDSTLSVANLTSGSLARVKEKDLGRLRILSAPAQGPHSLRVGYPSRKRSTPFFACDRQALVPPFGPGLYHMQASDHLYRVIPIPWMRARTLWPETLYVRQFDEAADQEIALERGELDVGVFWPGELSTHMRDQPRWQHDLSAPMARGMVAAVRSDGATTTVRPDEPRLADVDRELFRGDLDELRFEPPSRVATTSVMRFEVDPALPGRSALERYLSQTPGGAAPADGPSARLVYIDTPLAPPDSVARAVADLVRSGPVPGAPGTRADSVAAAIAGSSARVSLDAPSLDHLLREGLHVDPLFAIDCPVVFDARLRPYVSALGAKAFVELIDCIVVGGRR